ncbi:hypothetical protein H2204_005792 [Knufia peltigerae]|uniref:FAD-binding domain-containing protein n=1 Tax=Knufia peltigerae TaxID=1002370 RepID=A0AA39CZM6_9EURO|nr:hypothetical protein H2204_005792 [Knufia peltigerae]
MVATLVDGDSGENGRVNPTARGLHIIIAGAGIGGLAAAIALRQQGHHVKVYEQSRFANEIGAAIHVTPNAMGVLRHIGIDPRDSGAVPLVQTVFLSANNEVLRIKDNAAEAGRWQNILSNKANQQPWLQAHRAHYHAQLRRAAVSEEGKGVPVKIYTSSHVVSADIHTATITLADGSSYSADVVIGADGVHSKVRASIVSPPPASFKTSSSAFRFIIERKVVLEDPELRPLIEPNGHMLMWYSSDRKIVVYPTTYHTLLNFVCIHPANLSETTGSYDNAASKSAMLDVYKDFHPHVLALLNKADPGEIKVYPFFDMDKLPTFAAERLALIGDAAHPFTPHLAQGGAMAIEDAVSLAIMLDGSVTPKEVPERLQLYNQARYERASTIQEFSRQVGEDSIKQSGTGEQSVASFKVHEYIDYGLSHDEVHASTQLLRDHVWTTRAAKQGRRQPTVFGPAFAPGQDSILSAKSLLQPTRTSVTILFKTSATLLRNLFPNGRYYFDKMDTIAYASFSLDSRRNLAWLGGHGYDSLGLYVYGVCYKTADDQVIKGTFCPILFENLADTITTGREELGLPTMFSDIQVTRDSTSYLAKVSWKGAQWAALELTGLQASAKDPAEVDGGQGLLVHKYLPSTEVGKPDAQYDILYAPETDMATVSLQSADVSSTRFGIHDIGQKALPTLHQVVSRLAEIPVFEVVGASVKEYRGLSEDSKIQRLS